MIYFKLKDFIILPIFYLLICFLLYIFQRDLMYFPVKDNNYNHSTWNIIQSKGELLGLDNKNDSNKVIIVFHGNAGNANLRDYYIDFFPKDYHIIVEEYPGFGLNSTLSISQENLINHSRKLMHYTIDKYGKNIIIVGESIGTGIATQMANEFNISKLLLFTPYSTLLDVVQNKFWYAPAFLLLKDNYDSVKNLHNYKGNILLVIAENDRIIPAKHAFSLYDSIEGNKDKIVVKNAGHNTWIHLLTDKQLKHIKNFII